jgi:metal-responsive CopG/Arc/MetJ family transcriptional regulator
MKGCLKKTIRMVVFVDPLMARRINKMSEGGYMSRAAVIRQAIGYYLEAWK